MERHRSARAHLAVELDRAATMCSFQHNMLPSQLDRLLAMLLLARDEILWLFQHLDEVNTSHVQLCLSSDEHLVWVTPVLCQGCCIICVRYRTQLVQCLHGRVVTLESTMVPLLFSPLNLLDGGSHSCLKYEFEYGLTAISWVAVCMQAVTFEVTQGYLY
jgi:hypothetical protein